MKLNIFALLLLMTGGGAFLGGCTTNSTTTAAANEKRPDVELTSEKRSYSQAELQKRGRSNVGESLSAQDASVTLSNGGH